MSHFLACWRHQVLCVCFRNELCFFQGAGRERDVDMLKELQLFLLGILLLVCVFLYRLNVKSSCLFSCLPPQKSQQDPGALLSHGRGIVFIETSERMEPTPLVSCAVESAAKIYPGQPVAFFMKGLYDTTWLPSNSTYPGFSLLSAIDNVFFFPLDMKMLFEDTPLLSWYTRVSVERLLEGQRWEEPQKRGPICSFYG